jgi:hypothetical protein
MKRLARPFDGINPGHVFLLGSQGVEAGQRIEIRSRPEVA